MHRLTKKTTLYSQCDSDLDLMANVPPAYTVWHPIEKDLQADVCVDESHLSIEDQLMDHSNVSEMGTKNQEMLDESEMGTEKQEINDESDMRTDKQLVNRRNTVEARVIIFDESLVYNVLQKYYQRVRKELRSSAPSPEVLELSQRCREQIGDNIPRTRENIPFPVPYIHEKNTSVHEGRKFVCSTIGIPSLVDRIKLEPTHYAQLRFIFDIVTSLTTDHLTLQMTSHLGMDTSDETLDVYIEIFKYLCRLIATSVVVINGYCRVNDHEPNDSHSDKQWIAVLYEDKWMLIDPHPLDRKSWESTECLIFGSVFRKSNAVDFVFQRRIDEQFFVSPVEFVFSHFPHQSYWQLLMRPISLTEWQNMTYFTPLFFELKLCLISPPFYCVKMNKHVKQDFQVAFPQSSKLQFAAKMCSDNGVYQDNVDTAWTYVETDTESGLCNIQLLAPKSGTLKVYAMDIDKFTCYMLVVCFKIELTKDEDCASNFRLNDENTKRFPRNVHRLEWGPGNDTKTCGLVPLSHHVSKVAVSENCAYISFRRTKDDYLYDFSIEEAYVSNRETVSRRFVFFWYDADLLTFRVGNPFQGDVIFNVMKKETVYCSHNASVCSYLIHFTKEPSCSCIPPYVDGGKLGITNIGRKVKLIFTDYVNGIIRSNTSGEVVLRLQQFSPLEIKPRLHLITSCFHDMWRHVFMTCNEKLVIIRMNLPRKGDYLLSLYTTEADENKCLYNGLISVTKPSNKWAPYPELSLDMSYNIGIFSPKSGILEAKKDMYFSIEIPKSVDTAVVTCKGWTHLEMTGECIWEGLVTTGYAGTEVKVMARFEKEADEFCRVLSYKVISSAELEKKSHHQLMLVKSQEYEENMDHY